MKEVAEQLLAVMRTAQAKKQAGKAGNFQGILNKCRHIFDTTIKLQAGKDPSLLPLIAEATKIQVGSAKTFPGRARKESTASTSTPVNMAEAFDFQKKRAQEKNVVVASKPAPKVKAPATASPVVQTLEPGDPVSPPSVDEDLVRSLLETTPAKFRDRFGGVDGLKAFGKDLFGMAFEGEDDYAEIVRTIKAKLREILPTE